MPILDALICGAIVQHVSRSVRKDIVCLEVAHGASLAVTTKRGLGPCLDVKVREYGIEPNTHRTETVLDRIVYSLHRKNARTHARMHTRACVHARPRVFVYL